MIEWDSFHAELYSRVPQNIWETILSPPNYFLIEPKLHHHPDPWSDQNLWWGRNVTEFHKLLPLFLDEEQFPNK